MKLTPIQEKIINTQGNMIVKASAGTGKTFTMVKKIEKELEDNISHKSIAAITFTIKAAKEITKRLTITDSLAFIGTNNSFIVQEIIKPFAKDVYGPDFDIDMDSDYSIKVDTFNEGKDILKNHRKLSSYSDSSKNFIFEFAFIILKNSLVCQKYLKSKYFKIYIDEYQDCDNLMHDFFMYICDVLKIDVFVVGDEKQSIYMWRGAHPESFKSIWDNLNFSKYHLYDNFRSCQQIQNYTNLLTEDTRKLFIKDVKNENIIWISSKSHKIWEEVIKNINVELSTALLRRSNSKAEEGANQLTQKGLECFYIPTIPISDITTEESWIYYAVASYCILENYSVYDFTLEIPFGLEVSEYEIVRLKKYLKDINVLRDEYDYFKESVKNLLEYLGYKGRDDHICKLYETITIERNHSSFMSENYLNTSMTIHASKGLEFEQVILFTSDYNLEKEEDIFNHYVAASRAKIKLIIVGESSYSGQRFVEDLKKIFNFSSVKLIDIVNIVV